VVSCPRFKPAKLARRPENSVPGGVSNNTREGLLSRIKPAASPWFLEPQQDADAQALAQDGRTPKLGHPPLARNGMLIAAINPTVAPIHNIVDDGNIIGLDVDLGNAVAERLCLKMDFQRTQFATMILILKEGRIDMINSFMFYTPERASQVLMVPTVPRPWRSWYRRRTPMRSADLSIYPASRLPSSSAR
jgi:Bacterial extracellular solute-binding proteins, family 3